MTQTKSTYTLWNPVVSADLMSCSFDVTGGYLCCELELGTQKLMSGFLEYLKIKGEPKDWQIEMFCSAYYSDFFPKTPTSYSDEKHFRDRHQRAWRVKITFTQPCEKPNSVFTPHLEPISVYDYDDDTWVYSLREDSWQWTTIRYVAIVDFYHWKWEQFIANKGFEIEPIARLGKFLESYELYLGEIVQARFDLGKIHFPHEERKVMEFLRAFNKYNVSLYWRKSDCGWDIYPDEKDLEEKKDLDTAFAKLENEGLEDEEPYEIPTLEELLASIGMTKENYREKLREGIDEDIDYEAFELPEQTQEEIEESDRLYKEEQAKKRRQEGFIELAALIEPNAIIPTAPDNAQTYGQLFTREFNQLKKRFRDADKDNETDKILREITLEQDNLTIDRQIILNALLLKYSTTAQEIVGGNAAQRETLERYYQTLPATAFKGTLSQRGVIKTTTQIFFAITERSQPQSEREQRFFETLRNVILLQATVREILAY